MSDKSKEPILFKVGSGSNIHKVSEAIYKTYLEGSKLEIQAIGGGAVNQAVKSIAIAGGKLAVAGKHTAVVLGFRDIQDSRENKAISAINFKLIDLFQGE